MLIYNTDTNDFERVKNIPDERIDEFGLIVFDYNTYLTANQELINQFK